MKLLPSYSQHSAAGAAHTGIKDLKDFLLPTVIWCWVYQNHVFHNSSASVRTKSKRPLFGRFCVVLRPSLTNTDICRVLSNTHAKQSVNKRRFLQFYHIQFSKLTSKIHWFDRYCAVQDFPQKIVLNQNFALLPADDQEKIDIFRPFFAATPPDMATCS